MPGGGAIPESQQGQPVEARSSVKISQNAKGEAQVAVSVYEGATDDEMTRLRTLAVGQYLEAVKAVRVPAVAS